MNTRTKSTIALLLVLSVGSLAFGRIKLVALPERGATVIRLDNPEWTLIEEERVLTLQKTEQNDPPNKVDFSWNGVSIDADSIRLTPLDHPEQVTLLNVSYPPNEAALVWEISCADNYAENVRISYLLRNIDRLITYKAIADKPETFVDLKSYLVLRNFSGEDFDKARVLLDYGEAYDDQDIDHEETKQMLLDKADKVPITKVWTFDAAKLPWDPEKLENKNVGIPVSYRIVNDEKSGLGKVAMWGGKARLFQDDGQESTIFLGEDVSSMVPVGEKMELYIGDSRDIVVTQRKMQDDQIPTHKNNDRAPKVVLYDTNERIEAKIENFKDGAAVLTMIQQIPDEWDMETCTLDGKDLKLGEDYKKKDANTLEFEIKLPARNADGPAVKNLVMYYHRRHLRNGYRE